ncbi:MAG: two-component regulator propeller domain-containing protein [Mangrovibacterium sp.]
MNATSNLKRIYILLLWLFTANLLHAKDLYFTDVSVKDGLSQGVVYCIYQDKQGLMWFGTGDGLNRYNGYEFTIFKNRKNNPESKCRFKH